MELNITENSSYSSIEVNRTTKGYTHKVKLYYNRDKENSDNIIAELEEIHLKLQEKFPSASNGNGGSK